VSSAILYFAIVAIWAGVLMPRWLRPGRRRRYEVTEHFEMHAEVYETEAMPRIRGQKSSQPVVTERDVTIEEEITWTEDDAAERRANILKARRRMLGTLVALTLIAFVIAVAHVAAIWVVIPPALMLGGFVLLLREAARSDRERAGRLAHAAEARRGRAEAGRQAGSGRQAAPVTAEVLEWVVSKPTAPDVAEQAEPLVEVVAYSAEIIDISERVGDQFYDQYTDAANRAVGD
jgi:Flp pilus assembly protein TadB